MYRVFNRLKTGENCPVEICCPSDFEKYFNFLGWEWKVAIYIGEFTGGEVVFPDLDLSIKPESGDLLIWKYNLNHYVNTVKSGTRYVYTDLLVSPINVFFA